MLVEEPAAALDQALSETSELLERVAANSPDDLPAVVAGATVRIPRGVMLPEALAYENGRFDE